MFINFWYPVVLSRDRVLVIASPARRRQPGSWVHDCVPLVGGGIGEVGDVGAADAAISGMGV